MDALLDALTELDDIARRLAVVRRAVNEAIVTEGHYAERHSNALRESDEATANMGGMLCPDVCDANVVTHAFAPPAHDASECVKDEPPSRPA